MEGREITFPNTDNRARNLKLSISVAPFLVTVTMESFSGAKTRFYFVNSKTDSNQKTDHDRRETYSIRI